MTRPPLFRAMRAILRRERAVGSEPPVAANPAPPAEEIPALPFAQPGQFYSPLPDVVEVARRVAELFGSWVRSIPGGELYGAAQLTLTVLRNTCNQGYGGNQKVGYAVAEVRRRGDYQRRWTIRSRGADPPSSRTMIRTLSLAHPANAPEPSEPTPTILSTKYGETPTTRPRRERSRRTR